MKYVQSPPVLQKDVERPHTFVKDIADICVKLGVVESKRKLDKVICSQINQKHRLYAIEHNTKKNWFGETRA